MHLLTAAIGAALLILIGVVAVLSLVLLVLHLVRQITHMSTRITSAPEHQPPRFSWDTHPEDHRSPHHP